jgi:hypothetical protein
MVFGLWLVMRREVGHVLGSMFAMVRRGEHRRGCAGAVAAVVVRRFAVDVAVSGRRMGKATTQLALADFFP